MKGVNSSNVIVLHSYVCRTTDTDRNNETMASCPVFRKADWTRLVLFENTKDGFHPVTSCAALELVRAFAYSRIHGKLVLFRYENYESDWWVFRN